MHHWLLQAPAAAASAQPLYRPFMILFGVLLFAILSAVAYYLYRHRPVADAQQPTSEFTSVEMFKELVRSVLTATLTAGFIILTFEDKIDAGIFGNTYAIIIAFWFGQKMGEQTQRQRQATNGGTTP